ncbi:hypothetical protein J2751_001130 [Halorubrum alkaliphilum]|uniref:Uncharacterized protein n=1 Tax=Halorubrum alkaliphilum TaxID=261290 RepID=A0A8T4GGD8_9EURY|nr:hypothetical protein [Halorubrum alkaliphilum]MBP1922125.1 hypothetical protein [Halorubrum alkaliphilum]
MRDVSDRSPFVDLGLAATFLFGGAAGVAVGGWLLALPFGGTDSSPLAIYLELAGPASLVWLAVAIVALLRGRAPA